MLKIVKYSVYHLSRSFWIYFYFGLFLMVTFLLIWLIGDSSKVLVSLMNISLWIAPLIGILMGALYFYNSREFVELLLAQPITRYKVFLGEYIGISLTLSSSIILGIGLPLLIFNGAYKEQINSFMLLILISIALTLIFTGIGFLLAARYENKLRGFSMVILIWLLFTVVYDALLLLFMVSFHEFPIERGVLAAVVLNPIDLSRIIMTLQLDMAALWGYSGAIFKNFFTSAQGYILAFSALFIWMISPVTWFLRTVLNKDF